MAADYEAMVRELLAFYDFDAKRVVVAGAGGGHLCDYGALARRVIAVDLSPQALDLLRASLQERGLAGRYEIVLGDFLELEAQADVVLFEFSLHEMTDPLEAIAHAKDLAPDVLVFDHAPGSDWAFCVAEEQKVQRAWQAVDRFAPRARQVHRTLQRFATYAELLEKVQPQGATAVRRVAGWAGRTDIAIPMLYGLALV